MERNYVEKCIKKGFVWGCNDSYSESHSNVMEVTLTSENHGWYVLKTYIGDNMDKKIRYDNREDAIDSYMMHINEPYETECFYNEPIEEYA